MIQGRGRPGLALEALQRLPVVGVLLRQDLQRHRAAEADVLGPVDDAHATAAQPLGDAIVGDGLAGREGGRLRCADLRVPGPGGARVRREARPPEQIDKRGWT